MNNLRKYRKNALGRERIKRHRKRKRLNEQQAAQPLFSDDNVDCDVQDSVLMRNKESILECNGKINGRKCNFRVDTGSDITILSSRFFGKENSGLRSLREGLRFRYPTGEDVSIRGEAKVSMEIGKFALKMSMFVAEISDDCLLGADFLRKKLFEETLKELNDEQKKVASSFFREFQGTFLEEIDAGNCELVKHKIDVADAFPIRQVPRRIPFRMRDEVDGIIEDMKNRWVIEESQSP
ncbi:uncharacterized protein [Cardiocondyla obscurior]|uniref:uncharacterized protein n=1 Tax=Cardiocondyla obscurior TaxID=286306 RepID=UPI0039658B44